MMRVERRVSSVEGRWLHAALVDAALWALLLLAIVSSAARGQTCYTDPATGQRVCPPPRSGSPPSGGQAAWNDPRICRLDGGAGCFVAIDGRANYIATCAHGFVGLGDQAEVTTRHGQRFVARVVAIDQAADAALFEFPGTALAPVPLATREPPPGATIYWLGFPRGGPLAVRQGRVWHYDDPRKGVATGAPTAGDSGGPILDANGHLVGVLSGAEGGPVVFARLTALRRLIAGLRREPTCAVAAALPPAPPAPPATPTTPTCACAAEFAALHAELGRLRARLDLVEHDPADITALATRVNLLNQQLVTWQSQATVDYGRLTQEVQRRLPPLYFRVQDARGASFSTDYQPARLGSYVTLPFGPAP